MLIKRISLTEDKTENDQIFLLSVPAGEDSLAHRRHVCFSRDPAVFADDLA